MKKEKLNLLYDHLTELKKLEINSGSDGTIYKINNQILYKIYHESNPLKKSWIDPERLYAVETKIYKKDKNQPQLSEEKMKIIENEIDIQYLDSEGVRLTKEDTIIKAIEKQENVHLTQLPIAPLYIHNHFSGCVLKNYPFNLDIRIIAYFPLSLRLKIIKRLLKKIQELLNNNIYTIDLAAKPKNKSNILLTPFFEPQIIDLDGISAFYREKFSDKLYKKSIEQLNWFLLEAMFQIVPEETPDKFKKLETASILEENHFPENDIDSIIDLTFDIPKWQDLITQLEKKRIISFKK